MRKRFKQRPILETRIFVGVEPIGGARKIDMTDEHRTKMIAQARDISNEISANIGGVGNVYTAVHSELICEHCGSEWQVNWRGKPTCCDGIEWLG